MNAVGFKSLIVFALLAIFAFVAGSLASENATGALAPMALVLAFFFLIYLGKNCWILVFIVPPILSSIDLSILRSFPVAFLMCGVVLVYMLLLNMMGYFKLKWNGVAPIDILTAILCIYFLSTWVRHPVTIQALTSITDYGEDTIVGGKEYVWCIGAIMCYVALSLVPIKLPTLLRTMKWAFWLAFVFVCIMCAKGLITGNVNVGDEVANTRFGAFAGVSSHLVNFILAKYAFLGIILSPWKLALVCAGLFGMALSGFRGTLLGAAQFAVLAAWAHRQLTLLIVGGLAIWGSLVYLSHEKMFDDLPYGVRRVLSAVPGVDFENDKAEKDAEGSWEWRFEMWQWALDPSKGYIEDYVWGDGFGFSMKEESLRQTAIGLGLEYSGKNRFFAERGDWHNGAISIIQATGYVGLAFVVFWMVVASYYTFIACRALREMRNKEYLYIVFFTYLMSVPGIFYGTGDWRSIFAFFYTVALVKIVCVCLKQDKVALFPRNRSRYLPLVMSETNSTQDIIK